MEYLREHLEKHPEVYVAVVAFSTSPMDRGLPRKFNIWFWNEEKKTLERIFPDKEPYPAHWVPPRKTPSGRWKGGYFECSAIGMDRVFAIVYDLSYWLFGNGYKLNYKYLSVSILGW